MFIVILPLQTTQTLTTQQPELPCEFNYKHKTISHKFNPHNASTLFQYPKMP